MLSGWLKIFVFQGAKPDCGAHNHEGHEHRSQTSNEESERLSTAGDETSSFVFYLDTNSLPVTQNLHG